MRRAEGRVLQVLASSEGPAHDPYAVTTYVVKTPGRVVTLRMGELSGVKLVVQNGKSYEKFDRCHDRVECIKLITSFEEETGIPFIQFERIYNKVFAYDPDLDRYLGDVQP